MPWALHDRLVVTAYPKPEHLDKHKWMDPIGMVSLCSRAPSEAVLERVAWHAHIPIADGRITNLSDVIRARDVTLSMVNNGFTAVVHCVAGRNRSGLIGALVLRELNCLTGAEALAEVRRLRPRSVDNLHFEEFLMSLERPNEH